MRVRACCGPPDPNGRARDITNVGAPPYDQISPEQQDLLYGLSPCNIVLVSYPREAGEQKYTAARDTLAR